MNKLGVVLGIAAVATLAGCKDPDYKHAGATATQNDVKNVETTVAQPAATKTDPTVSKCTCPPGVKHAKPCACGASDCTCVVETKPMTVVAVSKTPVEPEYTTYVVQNGDYLAKVSKRFNVKIASIKRLNPSIKNDVICVGQKLKLPGKIDVSASATPIAAAKPAAAKKSVAAKTAAKKGFIPYTGATKEYVVKNGDTLGSIAYGSGINIRQFKDLNGLTSDSLKIGQKLKVPAEKVAAAKKSASVKEEKKVAEEKAPAAPTAKAETAPAAESAASAAEAQTAVAPVAEAQPAAAPANAGNAATAAEPAPAAPATTTYVVQEGDDMTGVSIRWGVSAAEIRELNNLAEGDKLVPGQIIKLPAGVQQ